MFPNGYWPCESASFECGRDRAEAEALRKESERRAKLYVRMQKAKARSFGMVPQVEGSIQAPIDAMSHDGMAGASADKGAKPCLWDGPGDEISNRKDTPAQHIKARHKQVEQRARDIVEEVLLEQGLDVYRYVEG